MNLLKLFTRKPHIEIAEHIKKQRKIGPPFYCGTAFCGHHTIKGASECWERKCARIQETNIQFGALLAVGKHEEACAFLQGASQLLYPEENPANWPINRSSAVMRAEYIEHAKAESK